MREKRLPVRMSLQSGLLQRSEGHIIRCICEGVDGPFTGMFGCLFLLLFWEVMNIYIDIKIESIGLPINLLCILQTCFLGLPINLLCILQTCFLVKGLSFHVPCGIF